MQSRVVYVLTIVLFGSLFACGGKQNPDSSDEEVIGKPPSEQDDPYAIMRTPEDAEEASSSGYIGPEEGDSTDEETSDEKQEPEAVRASKAEPPEEQKKRHRPKSEKGVQCFSCVRICPLSEGAGGSADCSGEERDVICGWGVHEEKASARELATAECDGALDMARRMQTWSRIEGTCPKPTCR